MTITIRLKTGNAAFEDDAEIVRILARVAREYYSFGPQPTSIRDINGNTVGSVTVTGK